MKKKSPVKAKVAPERTITESACAVVASETAVVMAPVKGIHVDYSCISGKPHVTFEGEWSRKQVRITLNAILRAYHVRNSKLRKQIRPITNDATGVLE